MPNYRRQHGTSRQFFFTVNLANRSDQLLVTRIDLLRLAFGETRRMLPFEIKAIVILPEHLHCIWELPATDSDYSTRWQLIKAGFSRRIRTTEFLSTSRTRRRERGIWQRRFWEHAIRHDSDYAACVDYIHYNPVKHGHAIRAMDWPYSTFQSFVKAGWYPRNWASAPNMAVDLGER